MYDKLLKNISESHARNHPWSATLQQIQEIYQLPTDIRLVQVARHVAKNSECVVFLCHSLSDSEIVDTQFNDTVLKTTDGTTLYAVPADIIWRAKGDSYRKSIANITLDNEEFQRVYVCYRDEEAMQKRWSFTRFIELHFL